MTLTQLRFSLLAFVCGSILCAGRSTAATVAYSNFDPTDNSTGRGYRLGNQGDDFETRVAQRFTPTSGGRLTKIELTLQYLPGEWSHGPINRDELTLVIVPDVNGKPSDDELWSQLYLDKTQRMGPSQPHSSYEVTNGIALLEGASYWLVARATSEGYSPYDWSMAQSATTEDRALFYIRGTSSVVVGEWLVNHWYNGVNDQELGLRVTVIPEPAAAAPLLAASATLLAFRRPTTRA